MAVRLGTRGSELARTQSGHVAEALTRLGHDVELVTVRTEGDINLAPLRTLGGVGVFAAALRAALLAGEVDFAVHSFKDLPTAGVPGLVVAAVPTRRDPRDVLVSRAGRLAELPDGARVGTGSPRRAAQLLACRADLEIVDIRGNVGTRLGRVAEGDLHAVVLASAGLERLGLGERVTEYLDLLPAPAQGALAVECREDDSAMQTMLATLDDPQSRFAATAERAVLAALNAGCAAPIGALTRFDGDNCSLSALVSSSDGCREVRVEAVVDWRSIDPSSLGDLVAERLLADGAADVTELRASAPSALGDFHC